MNTHLCPNCECDIIRGKCQVCWFVEDTDEDLLEEMVQWQEVVLRKAARAMFLLEDEIKNNEDVSDEVMKAYLFIKNIFQIKGGENHG